MYVFLIGGDLPISSDYVLDAIWEVIVSHFKELYK